MNGRIELREQVRERYAESARSVLTDAEPCCDCGHPGACCEDLGHSFGAGSVAKYSSPWR